MRDGLRNVRARLKAWSRAIKTDVLTVYLLARDDRVPWYVKALALAVAGYALSPIDLIPDFIPVLGYLDDLIIVPLGIAAVLKLVPPALVDEQRTAAKKYLESAGPTSVVAAVVIIGCWVTALGAIALAFFA